MALAQKPSSFRLEPGKGLLKGRRELQSNPSHGMIDEDVNKCEQWAWMQIISIFSGLFDTSAWDTDPPEPLPQLWELLASAAYLRFVKQEFSQDKSQNDLPTIWGRDADKMIRGRLPSKQLKGEHRMYFIKTASGVAGNIQWPNRDYIATIYVISSAIEFFPEYNTDTSHSQTTFQNFEDFFKDRNLAAGTGIDGQ